jgi:hypothetical protein
VRRNHGWMHSLPACFTHFYQSAGTSALPLLVFSRGERADDLLSVVES